MNGTAFKKWGAAAGLRSVRTAAQTAVATIGTTATFGSVDWEIVGSSALLAGVLSLLMSARGLPELDGSPPHEPEVSFGDFEVGRQ